MAALDRAVALAEREHRPVAVAEHLDLDVPGADDGALDVERAVREGGLGLGGRGLEGALELVGVADEAHSSAAAAGRRLQEEREAHLGGQRAGLVEARGAVRAGDEREPGVGGRLLRADLVPHDLDRLRARADEGDVVVLARGGELGVLGEEAPARVDGVAAGGRGRGDEGRDVEVALRGGRRADVHGLVGEPDVQRVAVGGRVDGDGLDPELVAGADDPDRDLAPVGDQDAVEHRRRRT